MNNHLEDNIEDELQEGNSPSGSGLKLGTYLRICQRKILLILSITGITTGLAFWMSLQDPDTYIGGFQLLVEPITSEGLLGNASTLTRTDGVPDDKLFNLDYPTQIQVLKSAKIINEIGELVVKKYPQVPLDYIQINLTKNLAVYRIGDTSNTQTKIIQVQYQNTDPILVETVIKVIAEKYLEYSLQERQTSIGSGVDFIDRQIPDLNKKVQELQEKKRNIQKENDFIDPELKGQQLFAQLQTINNDLIDIKSQLKEQQKVYQNLQKEIDLTVQESLVAFDLNEDPVRSDLLKKISDIESEIALISSKFTTASPNIQVLLESRNNLLKLLDETTKEILMRNNNSQVSKRGLPRVQNPLRLNLVEKLVTTEDKIDVLKIRYSSLLAAQKSLQTLIKGYPDIIRRYDQIEKDLTLSHKILDQLLTQRETLKVESAQKDIPWQIITPLELPRNEYGNPIAFKPNRNKKIGVGLVAGLFLGIVTAIILEKIRNVFYTPEDIKDITNIDVIEVIPVNSSVMVGLSLPNKLVKKSKFDTAFVSLYAKLSLKKKHQSIRSVVISSVSEEDGQSTIAYNLARAVASTGQRVLLVDGNMAKPALHKYLNLSAEIGIKQVINEEILLEKAIQKFSELDNLFLLSTGTFSEEQESTIKLWSSKMQKVMEQLHSTYDLIIYDPPHFFESLDTDFLIANTDGVLMVIALGKTEVELVKKALDNINYLGLNIMGIVVNYG